MPRDRLGNKYVVNMLDHKSDYVRVFIAKTKDDAPKQFQTFLIYFGKRFDCKILVIRTDSGGEESMITSTCFASKVVSPDSAVKRGTKPATARPKECIVQLCTWPDV